MGEGLRAMAEGVRIMIVHLIFVTWDAREDKAEQFIPRRHEESVFETRRTRLRHQIARSIEDAS
jgi:ATP:corrinoid adenosyltransferase